MPRCVNAGIYTFACLIKGGKIKMQIFLGRNPGEFVVLLLLRNKLVLYMQKVVYSICYRLIYISFILHWGISIKYFSLSIAIAAKFSHMMTFTPRFRRHKA